MASDGSSIRASISRSSARLQNAVDLQAARPGVVRCPHFTGTSRPRPDPKNLNSCSANARTPKEHLMTSFATNSVAVAPIERTPRPVDASIVSTLGSEPWKSSWWKTTAGERPTFLYIVAIHVLALIGLIFFATPGWRVMVTAVALAWLGGLGVTVCYHRTLAHTALRLNPVVKHLLIFFAMFNGSGSPDSWTANHRQHHSKVESSEDISSPSIGGFWWAHLRWLWQGGKIPLGRWCPDLDKREYRFWRRLQVPLLAVSLFGGLAFGITAILWLGPMRVVMSRHAPCLLNSNAPMRGGRGTGEDS